MAQRSSKNVLHSGPSHQGAGRLAHFDGAPGRGKDEARPSWAKRSGAHLLLLGQPRCSGHRKDGNYLVRSGGPPLGHGGARPRRLLLRAGGQ
eukprot:1527194-Pyramimonas_sp.AAC.1